MNKLIVTHVPNRENYIISAVSNGSRIIELDAQNINDKSILRNIYVGRVKNIVKNINAAFVEIEEGIECYYSISENHNPIFLNEKSNDKLVQGDMILVQVTKENIKTKAPVVSSNISLSGKYVVVSSGNTTIGISNKLNRRAKERLKTILEPYENEEFGIVARTNAKEATDQDIVEEILLLKERLLKIIQESKYRTCFSCVYKEPENYIGFLKSLNLNKLEEIVTDDEDIYNNFLEYIDKNDLVNKVKVRFYKDDLIALNKIYSLEKAIADAISDRVWLKSGAYIVIEPTEAFTVIDINTGKFIGKKKVQDTFLKINLEAAKEIALQLRLRNISGIVVIDFIDMKSDEYIENLMQELAVYLKEDIVTTTLVGRSPLNLVELTRKKVRKSLREQLCVTCSCCHGRGYVSC